MNRGEGTAERYTSHNHFTILLTTFHENADYTYLGDTSAVNRTEESRGNSISRLLVVSSLLSSYTSPMHVSLVIIYGLVLSKI